jgi:hypothetical protein
VATISRAAPQPIIHIGYHKTATSWFQKVVYPAAQSHHFVDRILVRQTLVGGGAFDFDPVAARDALGFDAGNRPVVICEEDLSGFLHSGFTSTYVAAEVARRLHAVAPEAQIVIFVRAQPAAAASHYQQYLREGGTWSARHYLFPEAYRHLGKARVFKYPHFRFAQLDYRGLISLYDTLFGRESVHVFAYEELALDRDRLLQRMRDELDLDFATPAAIRNRVNRSYRAPLLPLARFLNLFTGRSVAGKKTLLHIPFWYPARKHLLRQLNRLPLGEVPSPQRLLGPQGMRWIAGRVWESNRWLQARMAMDLRPLGYPLDPPDEPAERPTRSPMLAWMRN